MHRIEHKGKTCGVTHPEKTHEMWEESQSEEVELEELVDFDGSLLSSKIPLGINKSNKVSNSTTDDMVKTGHQQGNGFGYYYKRYWGEAYLGAGLGDIEELDAEHKTAESCMDLYMGGGYKLTHEKASDKCNGYGYATSTSQDKFENEEAKILIEISNNKMKDMLEVLLSKDDIEDSLTPQNNEMDLHDSNPIIQRMGKKFKKACEANGIDPREILNSL